MKIPVFEEIQLNQSCSSEYIEEKFLELHVGEVPVYIRTDKMSKEDLMETLPALEIAIKRLRIDPRLPYPVVILTRHITEHHFFPIVQSEEELTPYFNLKTKKLSKKEAQLLGKINIAKDKFKNRFTEDSLSEIKELLGPQKELYNLSKELHFYENLKKKLIRSHEKKHEAKKR